MSRAKGLSAASRLLKHSSIEVTRRFYEDANLDDLREAMETRAKDDASRKKKLGDDTNPPKPSRKRGIKP